MVSFGKEKIRFPKLSLIFDYFFPYKCPICGKECDYGNYICSECKKRIKNSFKFKIKKIGNKKAYYGFDYNDDIKKIVISYKYNGRKELAYTLAYMLNMLIAKIDINNDDIIVGMPMSKGELKERGFDHISLILNRAGIDHKDYIQKIKETKRQVGLSKKERIKNMKNAFRIKRKYKKERVFIFDDILTTGTSFLEASSCFKDVQVYGIILSHGGWDERTEKLC